MSTSTEYTEYLDDPGGKQAAEMATDPSVGLIIMVKNNGTVKVVNKTGRPLQDIPNGGQQPQVPSGALFRAGYVVYTTNPTCVRCLHGGQWKEVCW